MRSKTTIVCRNVFHCIHFTVLCTGCEKMNSLKKKDTLDLTLIILDTIFIMKNTEY